MTSRPSRAAPVDWSSYIESFHRERAGITERLLRRTSAGGLDPYEWLASALGAPAGVVLDVGAGSGSMAPLVDGWVGVDRSLEELAVARSLDRRPLVRAVADALPFRDASVTVAVLAMSLQVFEPVDGVMVELARVVQPGGEVVALLPARSPLSVREALLYFRLQRRLGQSITYPNDTLLAGDDLRRLAAEAGFLVTSDEQMAFELTLPDRAAAAELVASLYLASIDDRRLTLLGVLRPEYFVPVHGEYRHLVAHARLATSMQVDPDHVVVCEDGDQITLDDTGLQRSGRIPADHLYVDGLLDDVGHALLRDRRTLADEGVVVVMVTVDEARREQLTGPQIITRGWVYAPEAEPLLAECADEVRVAVEAVLQTSTTVELDALQRAARRATGQFVSYRTGRRPMIVPVVVEI